MNSKKLNLKDGHCGILGKENEMFLMSCKEFGVKKKAKVLVYILTKKQHKSYNKNSKFVLYFNFCLLFSINITLLFSSFCWSLIPVALINWDNTHGTRAQSGLCLPGAGVKCNTSCIYYGALFFPACDKQLTSSSLIYFQVKVDFSLFRLSFSV